MQNHDESLIDTKRAAPMLGLRPGTLVIWRCTGKPDQPPFVKVGRAVRYRPSDLREWVARHERVPGLRTRA